MGATEIIEDLTGVELIEVVVEGPAGASAYQIAVANGFVGTEAEWLASLEAGGQDISGKLDISAIDDTPVDNETAAPISSNWAFDHEADVTTKHLPSQAGASGQYLTSNGTAASWGAVAGTGGGEIDWANPVSVTTTANLTIGKHHVCTGTTANYTVTLPAVSGNAGKLISIEMAAALTKLVTVDGNGAETIDGELTRIMWAKETAVLLCDGVTWTKVGGKPSIPLSCSVERNTTAQTLGLSTATKVLLTNTINQSVVGMVDLPNSRIKILRPGKYSCVGFWAGTLNPHTSLNKAVLCTFGISATAFPTLPASIGASVTFQNLDATFSYVSAGYITKRLAVTDTIELIAYQDEVANYRIRVAEAGGAVNPTISVVEVIEW